MDKATCFGKPRLKDQVRERPFGSGSTGRWHGRLLVCSAFQLTADKLPPVVTALPDHSSNH